MIILVGMKKLFVKYSFLDYLTPIIAVVLMILRRYFDSYQASGAGLFTESLIDLSIVMLLAITIWRIFAGGLSLACKVSGGLTIPTLAYGFLVGGLLVSIIANLDKGIIEYRGIFMILTMVIVFAAVCDTPLAGLFIGLSMGSPAALALPLTIACVAYMVLNSFVLRWKSIYKDLEKTLVGYKEEANGEV